MGNGKGLLTKSALYLKVCLWCYYSISLSRAINGIPTASQITPGLLAVFRHPYCQATAILNVHLEIPHPPENECSVQKSDSEKNVSEQMK